MTSQHKGVTMFTTEHTYIANAEKVATSGPDAWLVLRVEEAYIVQESLMQGILND
jgi:hypothetical protein